MWIVVKGDSSKIRIRAYNYHCLRISSSCGNMKALCKIGKLKDKNSTLTVSLYHFTPHRCHEKIISGKISSYRKSVQRLPMWLFIISVQGSEGYCRNCSSYFFFLLALTVMSRKILQAAEQASTWYLTRLTRWFPWTCFTHYVNSLCLLRLNSRASKDHYYRCLLREWMLYSHWYLENGSCL